MNTKSKIERYLHKPMQLCQDKRLTALEQDYICLIAAFEQNGGCVASNSYFARYFSVARQTAQGIIGRLKEKGLIGTTEEKSGGKTIRRTITIIDSNSRTVLLSDSRKSLPWLAGSSDAIGRTALPSNGRKPTTHILKLNKSNTKEDNKDAAASLRSSEDFASRPRKENKTEPQIASASERKKILDSLPDSSFKRVAMKIHDKKGENHKNVDLLNKPTKL